jgi:hypothetical protein
MKFMKGPFFGIRSSFSVEFALSGDEMVCNTVHSRQLPRTKAPAQGLRKRRQVAFCAFVSYIRIEDPKKRTPM